MERTTVPILGERVAEFPETFGNMSLGLPKDMRGQTLTERRRTYPGTVTYVHPTGRWYQVTFDAAGIKECFFVGTPPQNDVIRDGSHYRGHPVGSLSWLKPDIF